MSSFSNFVQGAGLLLFVLLLIGFIFEFYLIMNLNSKIKRLRRRYDHLLRGRGEQNMEELVLSFGEDVDASKQAIRELQNKVSSVDARLVSAVQKVGLVRYDAFDDLTGELSFSFVLLDSADNGVVLTSIFGRENSQAYAKEIRGGKASQELSREEMRALDRAVQKPGYR